MAIKYLEAEKLRLETRKKLTATPENWIQFLRTASNTYKYSYQDQLMIAAQFPNATAVAAFDVWSDRFGRKIRAGEKGIGLIDDSGNYPRMRYVFDISQSVRYRDVPQPYVWDLQEELKDDIILSLAGDLSISIEEAVSDFCENTVDSLLSDYQNAVLSEAESSDILYGLDDTAINSEFRQVVFESVKFVALTRCGLSTDTVDTDVFRNLSDFSDLAITDILGTAISNISEQVLREIEATVKTVERRNQNERNIEEQNNRRNTAPAERGGYDILSDRQGRQADRFDIYSRPRNIRVSAQSDSAGGRSDNRTMGTETQKIPERTQGMDLSANDGRTESDRSPDSDRQGSRGNDRNADTGVDGERGRDGTAQSGQPNGVGTPPELNSEQSGRSSSEQSDIQVKTKQKRQRRKTAKAEEQTVSPVFSSFLVGEQMSLFADEKSEQDRANEYAMSKIISHGTAFEDGKFRIAEYFSEQHTKAEKAKFLSDEYGWGGYAGNGESMDYRPNKGITMSYTDKDNPENNITVHLTYPQLADMIDFLIANDMYITPADIEQRQQRAIYILKTYDASNPYEAAQIERAKSILESYNIDYSQLLASQPEVETVTPEQVEEMNASIPDDTEIPDINAPAVPIEQEETVYSESAVVAEFRNKTMESFHLIGDRTELDIELEVADLLRQEMIDNEIVGEIEAVVLYGSRSRGLETSEDTDIDIVVQINNAELKEDALFNIFSDMDIEIDGIPVDVNPIRPEETGTLDEYLPKAEAYLEQKQAERAAQMFSSSVGEQAQVGLEVPQAETRSNSMWDDYSRLKAENPDTILLYQVGDFFEAMGEDAQKVAKALDITLVSRAVGNDERVPMCGIPYHTLDSYTDKLSEQFSLTVSSVQDGERKTYNIPSKTTAQQEAKEFVPIYDGKWSVRENIDLYRSIVAENERFAQMAAEVIGSGKSPADSVKALTDEFGFERTAFLTALNIASHPGDGRFYRTDKEWACKVLADYINLQPDEVIRRDEEKSSLFDRMIRGGELHHIHSTHLAQFAEAVMPEYERYLKQEEEAAENKSKVGLEVPNEREALIEEAKKRINNFVESEYDSDGADFSDLSNIGIAYTTTEDEKHQIQASVDIENTSIVKKVDGVVVETTKYETLSELVDALNDLEFSELTYISDEQIRQIEEQTASNDIPDSVSVRIGFSESPIVNRVLGLEDTDELSEPLSFAAANAMFEYLDEKQHLERLVPSLEAGWYKKTDFEITAVIDGEEYTYSGKFDIGDGKGQGGGSLIDHISDFVDYTLSPTNPLHFDADKLAEQQKVKDILIPFLREHQQLTPDDERFINGIKYNYPMAVTEEKLQSLVGKTIDYNDREYVIDRIDIQRNKVHIRDDNTGWYPLFQDVELRNVVGQNIGLLLNEKEQFFRDCDLPSLMAKSSLSWDEMESLGRIFFDEDYIDRSKPSDTAIYGNGLKETDVYTLARKFKNIEDVSSELADGLFGNPTQINLSLIADGYSMDDVHINRTRDGYQVRYGMYSRDVTFEEISQAYLQYFQNEYSKIQKAVAEEQTQKYDFDYDADKFFFRENGVEEIYYNPDSSEGGQFVISEISFDDILEAEQETVGINDITQRTSSFFALLEEKSRQTLIDITSEDFREYVDYFNQPANLEDGSANTMSALIARAKRELRQEQQPKESTTATYKIYQLKDGEETRYKRFERLANQPEPVSITDYNLVYEAALSPTDTLDSLYEKFNLHHPEDFTGHSLSVSDVIVIEQDGQQQAHFVDSFGFQDVPDFFLERTQKAEQIPEQPQNADIELTFLGKRENFQRIVDAIHSGSFGSVYGSTWTEYDRLSVDVSSMPKYEDMVKLIDTAQESGVYLNAPSYNLFQSLYTKEIQAKKSQAEQTPEQPEEVKLKSIVIDLRPQAVIEAERADRQERVYQVITDNDGDIDDKQEYPTLDQAISAGKAYIADGYSGFSVFNRQTKQIEHTEGEFALYSAYSVEILKQNDYDFEAQLAKESADRYAQETAEETQNHKITDLSLGQRPTAEKFKDNLAAIRTLKQLEAEDRNATPEEQEILSKYTGWGGMSKVFEHTNKHYPEVRELLTDDEFAAARKSTMTAFYTSPVIIKEMYAKLADMGMNGGRLLEPSCGIGNFIGMIPGSNTKVTGIELDSLTGRIAQKLYPQAQIQVCGFENSKLKENSFDVAVGNVPFGDIHVYDKQYNPHNLLIHDYFFSKSLDMVKSGGVVAFITSKGTLDKLDPTARRLLAEKAEFLGAVRLPNNAFKANAGTEVTSDIIFLKKRAEPVVIEPDKEPLWIRTTKDSNCIEMNAYFATHPEQICGTMAMVSGQYGMESTCEPNRDVKLSEQLKAALSNIQGKIETRAIPQNEDVGLEVPLATPESLRNCSYFLSDGKPYFLENGESTPVDFPKSKAKKNLAVLTEMVAIRDTVRQLLEMQLDENVSDEAIKAVQGTLTQLYDDFAKKHGRIRDKENADVFKDDSSLPLLKFLERFDEKGEYIGKADIFTKRTIKAEHTVTEVATSVDALAVSLASEKTKGTVDLDYMSQLTGFEKEKIISDLQGVIFKIPNTDKYVPADEYLSGNILDKLEKAQAAFNAGDTSLAVNITALQKAMPEKLEASSIDVRLGSTWIKPEYIRDFVYQLVDTPSWHRNKYSQAQYIDVQYSEVSGEWFITNKGTDKSNVQATTTYGTSDRTAYQLIEDALNLKATTVKVKTEVDGKERYVVDATKTAQARAKQELIMQKFKEWIFADKSRRDDLVETYNRQFNSSRPREFDGSRLNFVGMNPEIQLRPHQLNAVARCLYGGNTLLAHEVGAGKTFEMIAAAMEGKRLGLHSKSLICVPNHLTEQIGADFLKLYPNANILVATKKDFEKENRKSLMAKIATGNYDAIIIGHSQLEKIPLSQERQQQYIREQIEETMRNIAELKANNGERYQIKQAEKTKANLEAKLQKLLDSPKDDTVTFEELGIDKLFLDEAHLFKNLFLSTKMQNVSGVSTSSDVQKTADLFMKTKYMDEITGGKGIVFATGTPVSNTMCEIYNMQRYLQMDKLREMHLEHFDAWASTFGENVTQMELTPEGNSYRAKTRFSKFFNLPELMAMFKECADIQTADTLNLPGIPECEVHNVAVEPSEVQKDLVDALSKRAEAIHNRQVDPSTDNMLKITTDGRKIGLDQRLINPDLPDEPGSKVNTCVDNVFKIWTDTAEIRGTQLVFCDFSTPKKDGTFNVYDDIKTKLMAKGVPEEQIAFIHDATNEAKREEMFSKVRSGEIRVLIGSTSKMGAGTNVQDRLVASHDLDAPYRPADMEQRRGRMVRQGNKNSKVHLYRYCTKDTFDAYLFQMLERKQSFISQIMTSKSPQRRCDDIDEATLSYAEVKALCVGDPRIKEKMELDNEVGKLRLERSSHQQEQYRLEDMLDEIKKKIGILETVIPKNQNDFLYIQKHPTRLDKDGKKIFEGITLNGKQYTDKKEAAEAFKNAYMSVIRQGGGHKDYVPVGEYRGFQVAVLFDSFSQMYKAQLSREGTYFLDLGTDNFTRMDNVLDKLESFVASRVGRLNEHKKQLKEVTDQIGKPFPKEAEYQAKVARLTVLNAELDVDGKKNEQGGISQDDTPPVQGNGVKR